MAFTYIALHAVLSIVLGTLTNALTESECPVCFRVVRAAKALGASSGAGSSGSSANSFERYCSLNTLEVSEAKFCYDTDSFKKDMMKLFDFGADEKRICKRVFKENPNFCVLKIPKHDMLPGTQDRKNARGVIYE